MQKVNTRVAVKWPPQSVSASVHMCLRQGLNESMLSWQSARNLSHIDCCSCCHNSRIRQVLLCGGRPLVKLSCGIDQLPGRPLYRSRPLESLITAQYEGLWSNVIQRQAYSERTSRNQPGPSMQLLSWPKGGQHLRVGVHYHGAFEYVSLQTVPFVFCVNVLSLHGLWSKARPTKPVSSFWTFTSQQTTLSSLQR